MAYTIYQYATVAPNGQPVEPAMSRTASQALGAAVQLAANTVYVAVVADADMYLRVSGDGSAATAADIKVLAGDTRGFPVSAGARPYLYGLTAA